MLGIQPNARRKVKRNVGRCFMPQWYELFTHAFEFLNCQSALKEMDTAGRLKK
jgi:hypothetical protein